MATNGSTVTTSDQSTASGNHNLSKDEVAWYFVEQYYTTLSKTPEKLHLFYSRKSQFVYGQETEVASVSVGRPAIQERIKSLDFQDSCKVRISNVDSQSSFDNIVIQVIGETSNKAGDEPKKFVQTFVLAQQPSGYFVLNDILRYIAEESDEEQGEVAKQEAAVEIPAAPTSEAQEHDVQAVKSDLATEEATPASSLDTGVVDQKLEAVTASSKDTASVNGEAAVEMPAEPSVAEESPAAPAEVEPVPDPDDTAQALAEEDSKEPEKPKDPSPTPVVTRQAAPAPAPAPSPAPVQAQPPKPMTWASRVAAGAGPRPAVPLPKTATPATATPPSRPAPQSAPSTQAMETKAAPAAKDSSEWQTAGSDSKRHNRPQSVSNPQAEKEGVLGYVKYVNATVDDDALKSALAKHGEVTYFDINRQKNCAFVEFATPAGYQAAFAANPHTVNGESIILEPRRPKASAYGGAHYGSRGGNMSNRGRGGFEGNRSGSSGGRGSFGGQNRGGRGMPRGGRGASQATNA